MKVEEELEKLQWLKDKLGIHQEIIIENSRYSNAVISMNYINGSLKLILNSNDYRFKNILLRETLIHELFHAKQYIDGYPCILDVNNKYGTFIQSSVLDLYVSYDMIKHGLYSEAKRIFEYRLKHLSESNLYLEKNEIYLYKLAFLNKESYLYGDTSMANILNNFILNNQFNYNLIDIFDEIDLENREKKYILNIYQSILKEIFKEKNLNLYDDFLIIN